MAGSTMAEVARLIAAWTPPARGGSGSTGAAVTPTSPTDQVAAIGQVLSGMHGQKSRRLCVASPRPA